MALHRSLYVVRASSQPQPPMHPLHSRHPPGMPLPTAHNHHIHNHAINGRSSAATSHRCNPFTPAHGNIPPMPIVWMDVAAAALREWSRRVLARSRNEGWSMRTTTRVVSDGIRALRNGAIDSARGLVDASPRARDCGPMELLLLESSVIMHCVRQAAHLRDAVDNTSWAIHWLLDDADAITERVAVDVDSRLRSEDDRTGISGDDAACRLLEADRAIESMLDRMGVADVSGLVASDLRSIGLVDDGHGPVDAAAPADAALPMMRVIDMGDGSVLVRSVDHGLDPYAGMSSFRWSGPRAAVPVDALGAVSTLVGAGDGLYRWERRRSWLTGAASRKNGAERRHRPVSSSSSWRYWTLATRSMTHPGVVVDVDRPDSWTRALRLRRRGVIPPWSYAIVNPVSGHAQFTWAVPAARASNPRSAALHDRACTVLTRILSGDPCFVRRRCQNPSWSGLRADPRAPRLILGADDGLRMWTLRGLRDWLDSCGRWPPTTRIGAPRVAGRALPRLIRGSAPVVSSDPLAVLSSGDRRALDPDVLRGVTVPVGMRHQALFRVATWLAWHRGDPARVLEVVDVEGSIPPSELRSIISQVRAFRHRVRVASRRSPYSGSEEARRMGRRGGTRGTDRQLRARRRAIAKVNETRREAVARRRCAAWSACMTRGGTSRHRVALSMGVSDSTLRRLLSEVRDSILAVMGRPAFTPFADLDGIRHADETDDGVILIPGASNRDRDVGASNRDRDVGASP